MTLIKHHHCSPEETVSLLQLVDSCLQKIYETNTRHSLNKIDINVPIAG